MIKCAVVDCGTGIVFWTGELSGIPVMYNRINIDAEQWIVKRVIFSSNNPTVTIIARPSIDENGNDVEEHRE